MPNYAATCELHKNIRRHYKRTGLNNVTTQWKHLDGCIETAKYTYHPDIVKFTLQWYTKIIFSIMVRFLLISSLSYVGVVSTALSILSSAM